MKTDEDFSIITVNSENDDEIVIQTGIPDKPVNDEVQDAASGDPYEAKEPSGVDESQDAASIKTKDVYHGVTESDLDDTGPFNKMRLIIIVCALLLIIGFIVYFVFLS